MKTKLVTFLMAGCMSIVIALAQPGPRSTPEERAKMQTEQLVQRLKLTEKQKEDVYKIHLKYAKDRPQMDQNMSREERREAFEKHQKKQDEELKPLFTPDQQKEYEKVQKERAERMRQGGGRR